MDVRTSKNVWPVDTKIDYRKKPDGPIFRDRDPRAVLRVRRDQLVERRDVVRYVCQLRDRLEAAAGLALDRGQGRHRVAMRGTHLVRGTVTHGSSATRWLSCSTAGGDARPPLGLRVRLES